MGKVEDMRLRNKMGLESWLLTSWGIIYIVAACLVPLVAVLLFALVEVVTGTEQWLWPPSWQYIIVAASFIIILVGLCVISAIRRRK